MTRGRSEGSAAPRLRAGALSYTTAKVGLKEDGKFSRGEAHTKRRVRRNEPPGSRSDIVSLHTRSFLGVDHPTIRWPAEIWGFGNERVGECHKNPRIPKDLPWLECTVLRIGGPFWIYIVLLRWVFSDQGLGIGGMVLADLTDAGYIYLGAAVTKLGRSCEKAVTKLGKCTAFRKYTLESDITPFLPRQNKFNSSAFVVVPILHRMPYTAAIITDLFDIHRKERDSRVNWRHILHVIQQRIMLQNPKKIPKKCMMGRYA